MTDEQEQVTFIYGWAAVGAICFIVVTFIQGWIEKLIQVSDDVLLVRMRGFSCDAHTYLTYIFVLYVYLFAVALRRKCQRGGGSTYQFLGRDKYQRIYS